MSSKETLCNMIVDRLTLDLKIAEGLDFNDTLAREALCSDDRLTEENSQNLLMLQDTALWEEILTIIVQDVRRALLNNQ